VVWSVDYVVLGMNNQLSYRRKIRRETALQGGSVLAKSGR